MEQYDVLDESQLDSENLGLSTRTINFLVEIRKWANFLAIMGFVGVGIMVVFGLFAGTIFNTAFSQMGTSVPFPSFFGFFYVLIALIYFFPVLYLYKFGANLKAALARRDSKSLETAFENLKSHYKFIGIMAIIVMSFYALGILFGLMAGFSSFM